MKIFQLICIFCLFFTFQIIAQNSNIDSILNSVKDFPESTKVDKLNEIATNIKSQSIITSTKLSEKSIDIAKTLGYTIGLIDALNNAGTNYFNLGKQEKALKYSVIAFRLSFYIDYKNGIITSSGNLAMFYSELPDYKKALYYYNISLENAKKNRQLSKVASVLNNIGNMYLNQDSVNKALDQYQMVLKIRKDNNDYEGLANVLNNIGNVYQNQKKYNIALEYFYQSYEYYLKIKNKRGISISFFNIGKMYELLNKKETAINYYFKSIEIAKEMEIKNVLIVNYQALSDYYTTKGIYDLALQYEKKRNEMKEIVFNEKSQLQISEIQAKFEMENKEKEIELLNKEKEIQNLELTKQKERNQLQIYILIITIILGFSIFLFYITRRKLKENALIEKTQAEQQKHIFNAIINAEENERKRFAKDLHDEIGPLLSSSKMYIDMILSDRFDIQQKNEMLDQTKTIIKEAVLSTQEIAHQLMPSALEDFGIIGALNVYFERLKINNLINLNLIENIKNKRFDKNIEITIYRVIKELINNTLKYANATNIDLKIIQNEHNLIINYIDNGKGFELNNIKQNNTNKLGGMGLNNIKSRISYINGSCNIQTEPNKGFSIEIIIAI